MEILNKYVYDPQMDLLGKGGFATVYKAYDKILEMPVALKFFHPQEQSNKYTIINEIKKAITLSHPNIVKYYGVETLASRNLHGQEEDVQIGVMEFVQEGQLKTYMSQHPLTTEQLKKLLIDVLEGLKYLHNEGMIHRDIKPQNILLGRDKQNRLVAKIADFGISKNADSSQASASILLGTIEYMAPEQFNPEKYGINKKISYNVDIWAFGVTAYYLLTGNMLFGSRSGDTSAAQMISKIVNAEGIGDRLDKLEEPFRSVLRKCIVSDANKRTSNIDELIGLFKNQQDQSTALLHFVGTSTDSNDETLEISIPVATHIAKSKKQAGKKKTAEHIVPDESNGAVTIVKTKKPKELETVPVKKKKTGAVLFSIVIVLAMAGFGYWAYSKYFAPGNLINKSIVDTKQEQVLSALASSMKYIRGGSFTMGTNDPKRNLDGPEHPVTVKPFLLDAYELTQAEWKTIMKDNRYTDTSLSLFPADSISWEDAKACIAQLNKLLSAMKAQGKTFPFKQFRLPADAEWEFAALNTAATEEQTALNTVSWNVTNSNKKAHQVGTRQANAYGIYDMLGNVYEWCEDWYGPYLQPSPMQGKVLRGGDYENDIFFVHAKARNAEVMSKRNKNIGFRLAADPAE